MIDRAAGPPIGYEAPMRILHGLNNIAGVPTAMARAERSLGAESNAVCIPADNPGYVPDIFERLERQVNQQVERFERYAAAYDVFVFHFGYSLALDSLADVPLLKAMGKTVIFYFHGCDIRQSKETIRKYAFSACRDCWPHRCNPNRDAALEMATRHADAIWVSTPDLLEFVPGSTLFPQPFDIGSLEFSPSDGRAVRPDNVIRIVHAPSDRVLKGTKYLVSAVEQLRAAGLPIELDLVENIPHEEIFARCRTADFAVEQLLAGSYGMFAVEMMAMGVPVICFLRADLVAKYPQPPPIAIADPVTIASVIQNVAARRGEWSAIAAAGRAYVENVHDARVLAARSLETYRALRNAAGAQRLAASDASAFPGPVQRRMGEGA